MTSKHDPKRARGGFSQAYRLLLAAGLCMQAGCNTPTALKSAAALWNLDHGQRYVFSADYAKKLPYASIAVSATHSQFALMILYRQQAGDDYWIAADKAVLVTRHGRLVRTGGLQENLTGTAFPTRDPIADLTPTTPASHYRRLIDIQPKNRLGTILDCKLTPTGQASIRILEKTLDTWRYIENCSAPGLGWKFENEFWVDRGGSIVQSRQYWAPASPAFEIQMIKAAPPTA